MKGFDVDVQRLSDWEAWAIKDSLGQRNLYRLQEYELGKLDEKTLPANVRTQLKPLIDVPFKSLPEFQVALEKVLTAEERDSFEAVLVKTAERAINAPDRSGGGLDVLGQLLLSGHGTTSGSASPEYPETISTRNFGMSSLAFPARTSPRIAGITKSVRSRL